MLFYVHRRSVALEIRVITALAARTRVVMVVMDLVMDCQLIRRLPHDSDTARDIRLPHMLKWSPRDGSGSQGASAYLGLRATSP